MFLSVFEVNPGLNKMEYQENNLFKKSLGYLDKIQDSLLQICIFNEISDVSLGIVAFYIYITGFQMNNLV